MAIPSTIDLVKARLGISKNTRDTYIQAIIDGIVKELEEEKGLDIDLSNPYHLMFIVDYSVWRYQNRDDVKGLPRHLQYRLHSLIVHTGGGNNDF